MSYDDYDLGAPSGFGGGGGYDGYDEGGYAPATTTTDTPVDEGFYEDDADDDYDVLRHTVPAEFSFELTIPFQGNLLKLDSSSADRAVRSSTVKRLSHVLTFGQAKNIFKPSPTELSAVLQVPPGMCEKIKTDVSFFLLKKVTMLQVDNSFPYAVGFRVEGKPGSRYNKQRWRQPNGKSTESFLYVALASHRATTPIVVVDIERLLTSQFTMVGSLVTKDIVMNEFKEVPDTGDMRLCRVTRDSNLEYFIRETSDRFNIRWKTEGRRAQFDAQEKQGQIFIKHHILTKIIKTMIHQVFSNVPRVGPSWSSAQTGTRSARVEFRGASKIGRGHVSAATPHKFKKEAERAADKSTFLEFSLTRLPIRKTKGQTWSYLGDTPLNVLGSRYDKAEVLERNKAGLNSDRFHSAMITLKFDVLYPDLRHGNKEAFERILSVNPNLIHKGS